MTARMAREIKNLTSEPPPGISAWPENDTLDRVTAQVQARPPVHLFPEHSELIA